MYPYNRKTQLYHTPIRAKERTDTTRPSALSTDRRLQELLVLARQEAAQLAQKYAALLQEEALAEAHDIIKTMETDGKKHQRILREVLFLIFSDSEEETTEEMPETKAETENGAALLEELLLTELDDIPFYRALLFAMEEDDLWNLMFEILTDKQNHAAALNHLYAKYFTKTSGQ